MSLSYLFPLFSQARTDRYCKAIEAFTVETERAPKRRRKSGNASADAHETLLKGCVLVTAHPYSIPPWLVKAVVGVARASDSNVSVFRDCAQQAISKVICLSVRLMAPVFGHPPRAMERVQVALFARGAGAPCPTISNAIILLIMCIVCNDLCKRTQSFVARRLPPFWTFSRHFMQLTFSHSFTKDSTSTQLIELNDEVLAALRSGEE